MKFNRPYLIIAVSSLALLIVLCIQVNWIFESARVKEEIFNEKASMVLSKTAEALRLDTATCKNLIVCIGQSERHKIDSLFNHFMKVYNVRIGYYFEVKNVPMGNYENAFKKSYSWEQSSYKTCLSQEEMMNSPINGGGIGNGVELKLVFPDKEQFITEEMGIPFISSVVLILVVIILFWRTTVSLKKEKEISEHTTEFLNNMTHEFKTPLTNIALAGKMILKDQSVGHAEKAKYYSGIILEENEKLKLQVEQVLGMTALERGEIPLRKTEIDAHHLIQEVVKCIGVQLENRQGSLDLKLEAKQIMILGDKTHLANALCNLIDNAIKYSKEKPEISIYTYNEQKNLVIVVSDKGIGIEEQYQEKVFDKYFRVPTGDVHDVKGFGLGLAYTKKIVELHGKIQLDSEQGRGTKFTISIPYV